MIAHARLETSPRCEIHVSPGPRDLLYEVFMPGTQKKAQTLVNTALPPARLQVLPRTPVASPLTSGAYLDDRCLLDLLSEQVRAQPERTAVKSRDGSLTYRELMRLSSAVGARLRALGVGQDDCVGLFVEPSLDLMVGVWGILSALPLRHCLLSAAVPCFGHQKVTIGGSAVF